MKRYLDENDTMNSIRLQLCHPHCKQIVWILVEGSSDQKVYGKLFSQNCVSVDRVHGGVESLRKAVSILADETDRVIGIRDADFLHLTKQKETIKNMFLTDWHDLEMMLIHSDRTFCSVFAEFSPNEMKECLNLRDKILASMKFLGGLRFYNDINDCRWVFRRLGIGSVYQGDCLQLNEELLIKTLNQKSKNMRRIIERSKVEELIENIDDLYNLCCGHDVVGALALYFLPKQLAGFSFEDVYIALRTAYSIYEFRNTQLYKELSQWEKRSGYQLFDQFKSPSHREPDSCFAVDEKTQVMYA